MPAPFKRLSIAEFALLLERFQFTRQINSVHMHHTWRPNHSQFRGHETIEGMWRFHTQQRNFSDIAQHLTIDPEGFVWTGRNWNSPPASATGFNGNASIGPFMFETIGDFDRGMDKLEGKQLTAVCDVIKLVQLRFKLAPESLMFHQQMSRKSCPGTAIVRDDFIRTIRDHTVSAPTGAQRSAEGPFDPSKLSANENVARAIERLTDTTGVRAASGDDNELDYDDQCRSASLGEYGTRGKEPELGPETLNLLRPHVINLRMGDFSDDGRMTTTTGDVDAIFHEHLPRWVKARKEGDVPARIVFYAHGGLVSESTGLGGANRTLDWWMRNGVYPIYFIWETGLFQTLGDLLLKVKGKAVPEGARDLFDWTTDPVVEEAARALQAPRIWGGMKASAALASAENGGARYVAERLQKFMKTHGDGVQLHAIGHSAGSIFHGHFLPLCRELEVAFDSLQLLAPAITCEDFKRYLKKMTDGGGDAPHTTMFTMSRTFERADQCQHVYRKSLLYLVSEACEGERKTPILGLEDSLRDDEMLREFFGLRGRSDKGTVVWSKSPTDTGRSATRSTTHGGFDDDAPTMSSVLRRIRDLEDAHPIDPFPAPPAGRDGARDWSNEVDWPDAFDRAWTGPQPPQPFSPSGSLQPPGPQSPPSPAGAAANAASTGRRIAVCIGINAYPTARLNGCVKDAEQWQSTFSKLGFATKLVTDSEATRLRVLSELKALVENSRAGDTLVFQYAGHGTQLDDLDGDEASGDTPGQDEAICPVDFADGQFLIDDDIAEQVAHLPDGVQLFFILDCCHSGTGSRFAARATTTSPDATAKPRYIEATTELRARYRQVRRTMQLDASRDPLGRAARAQAMREVTFAACRSKEVAWESEGQGEFTRRAHEVLARGTNGLTNAGFLEAVLQAFGPNARQQPQLDCDVALRASRWLGI